MGSLVTDFDSFIVESFFFFLLLSLHFDFFSHVVTSRDGSTGHGMLVKSLRAFQRHGANGSVESAAHERDSRIQLGESRRSVGTVRRACTHFWREDPIAWFGSAQSLACRSGEHLLGCRAQKGNVEQRLCKRLRNDDGCHGRNKRLNGRTTTHAPILAGTTLRRCTVVVVGSRGVLVHLGLVVMFRVVRLPLLMRGYGIVLVNRTGIAGAGPFVIRATANMARAI